MRTKDIVVGETYGVAPDLSEWGRQANHLTKAEVLATGVAREVWRNFMKSVTHDGIRVRGLRWNQQAPTEWIVSPAHVVCDWDEVLGRLDTLERVETDRRAYQARVLARCDKVKSRAAALGVELYPHDLTVHVTLDDLERLLDAAEKGGK